MFQAAHYPPRCNGRGTRKRDGGNREGTACAEGSRRFDGGALTLQIFDQRSFIDRVLLRIDGPTDEVEVANRLTMPIELRKIDIAAAAQRHARIETRERGAERADVGGGGGAFRVEQEPSRDAGATLLECVQECAEFFGGMVAEDRAFHRTGGRGAGQLPGPVLRVEMKIDPADTDLRKGRLDIFTEGKLNRAQRRSDAAAGDLETTAIQTG